MGDLSVTNFSSAPPGSFPATVERKTDPAPGTSSVSAVWGSISGNILSQIDLQQQFALKAGLAELNAHIADTGNPHHVTKAQVGLGNADNMSAADIVSQAIAGVIATYPLPIPNGGTGATTATQALINLGGSTSGRAVFVGTPSGGRAALGSGANGDALFTGATAAANRTTLGSNASGDAIFTGATAAGAAVATAATAAAQRTALGSGTTGDAIYVASTVQTVRNTLGLNQFGWRNRLRNARGLINQRLIAAAQSASGAFVADAWQIGQNGTRMTSALITTGGPVDSPAFIRSTVTSTGSPAATEYQTVAQGMEGLMVSDLGWGSAGAFGAIMSISVRSSVAGTYALGFRNGSAARSYIQALTINAPNVWEDKTFYVPPDVTGTWPTGNTTCISFFVTMAAGSTFQTTGGTWQAGNFIGLTGQTQLTANAGATFDFTKAQFEPALVSTQPASPFEAIPYDVELDRAQRYLPGFLAGSTTDDLGTVLFGNASTGTLSYLYKRPVRVPPTTLALLSGTVVGNFSGTSASASAALNSFVLASSGTNSARISIGQAGATWSANNPGWVYATVAGAGFVFPGAEL